MANNTEVFNDVKEQQQKADTQNLKTDVTKEPTPALDKWAESVFPSDMDADSAEYLSRFGLHNPEDIRNFLLSSEGQTVRTKIAAHVALEHAYMEEQRMQIQEDIAAQHRLKAILFLWFAEKEADASEKLKGWIEEQNSKAIKNAKEPEATTRLSQRDQDLTTAITSYNKAIESNIERGELLKNEEKELKKQLETLDKQEKVLTAKHLAYDRNINEFDTAVDMSCKTPDSTSLVIEHWTREANLQSQEVIEKLDAGDEEGARTSLNELNALNLKIASLKDLHAQQLKKHDYVNDEGQPCSAKEAQFVVKPGQKIVKDEEGKHHLINLAPGQDLDQEWNRIKEDPVAKTQTHQNFENSKQELMSVKKVVHHHKNLETAAHNEQVTDTKTKIKENQAEQVQVENQITLLQSARANAQTQLNQPNLGTGAPSPKPMPSSSVSGHANVSQVAHTHRSSSFKDEVLHLKGQQTSSQDLYNLANNISDPDKREEANTFLKENVGKATMTPLNPTVMATVLRNMPILSLNPNNPSVTNEPNSKDQEKAASTNPNAANQ